MPSNVLLASPLLVFPNSLSTSFTESSVFPVARNDYHDSTIERYMIVYTSPLGTDYDPPWGQAVGPVMSDAQFELVEVA